MQDEQDEGLPGQDSFIDVVCNMVGILIILVMIVGVRASSAVSNPVVPVSTADVETPADQGLVKLLEQTRSEIIDAQQQVERAAKDIVDLAAQAAVTDSRRQELTLVKATVEQAIQDRRAKLDDETRRQFDVQRKIAEAEIKLHQLQQEQIAAVAESSEVQEIECVPTPLAREVTGETIHLRLKHGLLAVVPVDQLLAEVERRGAHYLRNNLKERNQAQDVFGPIDGFRMRLSVERQATPAIPGSAPPGAPVHAEVVLQGVFTPTSDQMGQSVEQAMLPTSPFMHELRAKRAASPAVVVWAYPDSYAELGTIKRAMWDAGVPLAIRPLPNDQPIIFSTLGTRAAAQ